MTPAKTKWLISIVKIIFFLIKNQTADPGNTDEDKNGHTIEEVEKIDTSKSLKYNNFVVEQEREDEQPISTMKQEEKTYVKAPTPKCDIELPEKIAYPSAKSIGHNEDFPNMEKDKSKPRRRSTSNFLPQI